MFEPLSGLLNRGYARRKSDLYRKSNVKWLRARSPSEVMRLCSNPLDQRSERARCFPFVQGTLNSG
jgi:hypothetical protein